MRALVMEGFGPPEQARPGELTMPQYGPDDVLVQLGAAGINPVDWKEMAGFLATALAGGSVQASLARAVALGAVAVGVAGGLPR